MTKKIEFIEAGKAKHLINACDDIDELNNLTGGAINESTPLEIIYNAVEHILIATKAARPSPEKLYNIGVTFPNAKLSISYNSDSVENHTIMVIHINGKTFSSDYYNECERKARELLDLPQLTREQARQYKEDSKNKELCNQVTFF